MRSSSILAVCGTCLAVCGAAFAQNSTTRPDSNNNKDNTINTRPATQPERTARGNQQANAGEQQILRQLEGTWKVEVSVNTSMWNPHLFKDGAGKDGMGKDRMNKTPGTDGTRQTNPGATTPGTANPGTTNPGATNPGTTNPGTTPGAGSPPGAGTYSTAGFQTFTAYSGARLVLGDNVLQQTTIIPDMPMMKKGMDATMGRTPESGKLNNKSGADDEYKGMFFLSFDEPSNTYNMVFMDNCHGQMHFASGNYDSSTNRIVFNSSEEGYGRNGDAYRSDRPAHGYTPGAAGDGRNDADRANDPNRTKNPGGVNANDPRNNDVKRDADGKDGVVEENREAIRDALQNSNRGGASDGMMKQHGDVQVVLEIISPDEHRVTMYTSNGPNQSDRLGTPGMDRPGMTPDGTRDRVPTGEPARTPDPDPSTNPTRSNSPSHVNDPTRINDPKKTTDGTRSTDPSHVNDPSRITPPTNPGVTDRDSKTQPGDRANPNAGWNNRDLSRDGRVVYRAVYTRAAGAELAKFRDLLRTSESYSNVPTDSNR